MAIMSRALSAEDEWAQVEADLAEMQTVTDECITEKEKASMVLGKAIVMAVKQDVEDQARRRRACDEDGLILQDN
jgi:hypothetical protein